MNPSYSYSMMSVLGMVAALPLILVAVGGAAIAVARHHRHPRASIFLAAGCLLLVVVRIVGTALNFVVPMVFSSVTSLPWIWQGISLAQSLATAVGIALLIYAALVDRPGAGEQA